MTVHPTPPGSFGIDASDNLAAYFAMAQLPFIVGHKDVPKPPPEGHKSHLNSLRVRPERHRRLERIVHADPSRSTRLVTAYAEKTIPDEDGPPLAGDIDPTSGRRLTVPCNPTFNVPKPKGVGPVNDKDSFEAWLLNMPLETTERAMHLVFPKQTYGYWRYNARHKGDADEDLVKIVTWETVVANRHDPRTIGAVIFIQPLWVLADRDMKSFLACTSFPSFDQTRELNSSERLWAKIYDSCIARHTPWFVLTNYNTWAFGVFSKGWTKAHIVHVCQNTAREPTVIQTLFYWLASSMHFPDTFVPPEVRGECPRPREDIPCLLYDVMAFNPCAARAVAVLA
ncbi:hypothetical protein FA95DRAFT_1507578 [Auriscalpium vulgare]|uniref:Uncharacterized protein n=1 Tax=Auriscalpium vulgare TaxID=40419 RepID=A0ACB8SC42_9AGAM|nr:hypothetical protein FA95DRAFT_1507578 [Auriscalpium vulgare]